MSFSDDLPVDLDQVSTLARQFVALDMVQEAAHLFEMALRLDPHNRGLQLGLAQLRNRLKTDVNLQRRDAEHALREQFRRNAIDAWHFFGLGALYRERGNHQLAAECLEIAREKEPIHPSAYALEGRMLAAAGNFGGAAMALRTARRFNPFDVDLAALLGEVEERREQLPAALASTIDALLLLPDEKEPRHGELKERIRHLKRRLDYSGDRIVEEFQERQIKLQTDFDRLEMQRERYLHERAQEAIRPGGDESESGRIVLAVRLRQFEIWQHLNDEHIFQITRVVHQLRYPPDRVLFQQGDSSHDLYLLEEGEVLIRRPTHYGNFEIARLGPGTLMGEVSYISRFERSADGVTTTNVKLMRIDASGLDALIDERPDLGVKIFMSFWQGLAQKLRGSNEQLKTFFRTEGDSEQLEKLRQAGQGAQVLDASSKTLQLLKEKGLSGDELKTLADFSNVKRFPGGTFLFHEGDPGDTMYVVLEGKVMISKFIPGGGEEALAILSRGDFFGEMALIDDETRSADAKAFQGPATVVAFDRQILDEVEQADPNASIDLIRLLCQLMCQRLREADEKVTSWRIMSGQRPDQSEDLVSFDFPPAMAEV